MSKPRALLHRHLYLSSCKLAINSSICNLRACLLPYTSTFLSKRLIRFLDACTSAFSLYPHNLHSNCSCVFLFSLSTYPQLLHVCDVYAGFISTICISYSCCSSCSFFSISFLPILAKTLLTDFGKLFITSFRKFFRFSTMIIDGLYKSTILFIILLISFFMYSFSLKFSFMYFLLCFGFLFCLCRFLCNLSILLAYSLIFSKKFLPNKSPLFVVKSDFKPKSSAITFSIFSSCGFICISFTLFISMVPKSFFTMWNMLVSFPFL